MSGPDDAALHDALIALGLATMGASPAWDIAVTELLVWMARTRANERIGAMLDAEETFRLARHAIKAEHGYRWSDDRAARGKWTAAALTHTAAFDEHVERFYGPLWAAQRALVATPAPTLAAALFKARIAEQGEVWNDNEFTGDCPAIVDADLAKFLGDC